MSKKYTKQKFLLNCDYENVDIKRHMIDFDFAKDNSIYTISVSELDAKVDTVGDMYNVVFSMPDGAVPVLLNDRPHSELAIITEYSDATIKAYIKQFELLGKECYITAPEACS